MDYTFPMCVVGKQPTFLTWLVFMYRIQNLPFNEERPGQPKKLEDEELEALLDEDRCQTQEELTESLGFT